MSATDQPKSVVSVPVIPTDAMIAAGEHAAWDDDNSMPAISAMRKAWSAMLAAAPLPQGEGLADAVQWHRTAQSEPEPGLKFVALYDDGSGAWLGFKHDGGVIDAEGDDYGKMPNAEWWAYLPTGFRLGCEDHPCSEYEVDLPFHAPPRILAQPAPPTTEQTPASEDREALRERDVLRVLDAAGAYLEDQYGASFGLLNPIDRTRILSALPTPEGG